MKRVARKIHLTLALVISVFLVLMSLTGALLIYAKDIQLAVNPELWQRATSEAPLDLDTLYQKVQEQSGQKIEFISIEEDSRWAWQARLADDSYASLEPSTAEVLHSYAYYDTLYGFTMGLHRWLLWRDGEGKMPLRNWVSTMALGFMLVLLVGFYLWVKPKQRLKRLKINRRAKARVINRQVHHVLGVYTCLPLLLIAFSGIAFNWKAPTQAVVNAVLPGQVESRPRVDDITPMTQTHFQEAFEKGLAVFPEAALFRIYFPKSAEKPLALRLKQPGESHAYSWVWVNPYSAQVINSFDGAAANLPTQVWNFKYKFHIGDFAGPIVQVLWLLLSLLPVFFVVSGLVMWRGRK
ncbi:PepSY-associated TM helix domain-containing protein [Pseudoalteromonas sp. T1lg22]|uniref:PepSY-associated TM helix domain-containing protein n=1 Tax=Pseudoalteromonas sp. T1lg22 TaxID=2077096 RepID=UPI000CF5F53D|nr:PepSY-associated TM helix domain-containing protein [Pseudoalteromonas sp. T1lg22]